MYRLSLIIDSEVPQHILELTISKLTENKESINYFLLQSLGVNTKYEQTVVTPINESNVCQKPSDVWEQDEALC